MDEKLEYQDELTDQQILLKLKELAREECPEGLRRKREDLWFIRNLE